MKSLSRYTAIVLAAFLGSATLAHAQDGWRGFGRTREYYESSGPSPLDWVRFGTRIGGAVIGGLEKQGHHGLGHHGGSRYVRPYYPHQSYPRRPVYVVPPQHVSPPTTTQTIRPPAPPNQAPTARTTVVRNAPPKRNATASFALTDYDNPNQDLLDNAFGKEGDTADPYTPDDDDDLFGGGDDDLFGDDPVVDEIKFPETDNKPSTDTTGPTTKPEKTTSDDSSMSPLDTSASSSVPPTTTQPELTSGKTGSGKPSTSSGSKPKPSSGGTGEQKPSTKPGSPTKPGGTSGSTTSKPPATTGSSPPTTAGGQPTPTPTPTPTPPLPFKWGANSGSNTATTTSPGGSSGSGGWHPSSPWNNGGVSNASSGGRPDRYRPDADWWSRPRYNGGAASSNSASNAPGRTSTPNSTASRTTTTVQNRPPVNSAPPALSSSQPPIPASGDSRFVDSVNPAGVTGGTDAFGPRGLDPNRGADSAFDELGQQMFGKDFESRVGAAATTGAITTMTQGGSPRDIAVSAATDAAVKATVEVGKEVLLETGLKDTWNNVTRSLGAGGDSDTSWNINVDFEKGKVKDVMFNISAPLK